MPVEEFNARRNQAFWQAQRARAAGWDELIGEVNERTGVLENL